MKKILGYIALPFCILFMIISAPLKADQVGYVFDWHRVVVIANNHVFDSDHGSQEAFASGTATLVGNEFYLEGDACVIGACYTIYERFYVESQTGSSLRVISDKGDHLSVTMLNKEPLQIIINDVGRYGGGAMGYGFGPARQQVIDSDWMRARPRFAQSAILLGIVNQN